MRGLAASDADEEEGTWVAEDFPELRELRIVIEDVVARVMGEDAQVRCYRATTGAGCGCHLNDEERRDGMLLQGAWD
jgi:hypothetical protein